LVPDTGAYAGEPSISTRMAGTFENRIRGGSFLSASWRPLARASSIASAASSRSSSIVRTRAGMFC
jgi:hypothetical protein